MVLKATDLIQTLHTVDSVEHHHRNMIQQT